MSDQDYENTIARLDSKVDAAEQALADRTEEWSKHCQAIQAKLERYEQALKTIANSGFAYIDKAEEIAEKALKDKA